MYAKIYDFDPWDFSEDTEYIVRKVDKMEGPCKLHDYTVIWYSGGLQSYSFDLIKEAQLHE